MKDVTFAEYDEGQNRGMYTIKTLMTKLTKEYPTVLKQRLISVDLITEKKIQEPLDYFSQEASKLLYRLNNCYLMSEVCQSIFGLLDTYD